MNDISPYITIGGMGTRLKKISPLDKHLLYFRDKQIIKWILDIIPNAKVIGKHKTKNRKETLKEIPEQHNILIIDCDIIPFGFDLSRIDYSQNCVFVFNSHIPKWGSLLLDSNNRVISSSESQNISNIKASGIYFIKDIKNTIELMTDENSILSGLVGAKTIYEDTFVRLGDIEDYVSAIKQSC